MYLTQPGRYKQLQETFRPLLKDEKIETGDLVEDLTSGRREPVDKGYYGFLRGHSAKSALGLPSVHQIVRKM